MRHFKADDASASADDLERAAESTTPDESAPLSIGKHASGTRTPTPRMSTPRADASEPLDAFARAERAARASRVARSVPEIGSTGATPSLDAEPVADAPAAQVPATRVARAAVEDATTHAFVPTSAEGATRTARTRATRARAAKAATSDETPRTTRTRAATSDAAPRATRASRTRKPRKLRNIISTLLIVVGAGMLLVAAGMTGWSRWRYYQQNKVNRELAAYATLVEPTTDPDTGETVSRPPEVDWAGLKAINPDIVGWIQIPDSIINYPVYQSTDNEHYLRHTATGEWTWGGQIFLDYECSKPGMVDQHTLVYGHHLSDGSMFKPIADLDVQEEFDKVKTVWYVTESKVYECEPVFLYYTQADDFSVRTFQWESEDAFHAALMERLATAVTKRADAAEVISRAHHAMSLITCNYYAGYGRTLLVIVPKDEVAVAPVVAGADVQTTVETPTEEVTEEWTSEDEYYEDEWYSDEYYEEDYSDEYYEDEWYSEDESW